MFCVSGYRGAICSSFNLKIIFQLGKIKRRLKRLTEGEYRDIFRKMRALTFVIVCSFSIIHLKKGVLHEE